MEVKPMRRSKHQLDPTESDRILRVCIHGVLALCGDGVHPYAVPLSYVYDGSAIYFHSATSGHKLDEIAANPNVSFCVVEKDDIVPEEYTSYFRSVIIFGRISEICDDEAMSALKLMCEKYSPGLDHAEEFTKCVDRVKMLRLDIDHISGKEAIELVRNRKL